MGLFRGGVTLLIGTLLFLSLLSMNILGTFSSSLEYNGVVSGISPVVYGLAEESGLSAEMLGNLNLTKVAQGENVKAQAYCRSPNRTSYNFTYEGFAVDIPCETAFSGNITSIIDETVKDVVYGIYYATYDCNFWDCFSANTFPFFLVSEKAHDYWKGKFYLALLASIIFASLFFLFMEKRINAPIIFGILLVLSAIPILKLAPIISAIVGEPISLIIGIFFISAGKVFWIAFIIGLVLIALGFGAKIMDIGFIKNMIEKKPWEKLNPQTQEKSTSQKKSKKK